MQKLWYLFSTLKPSGALHSHVALWIGIILYSNSVKNVWAFILALLAFLVFYGALYAMNDIADYELDMKDENNKDRVIASGLVTREQVLLFIVPLWLITLGLMYNYSVKLAGLALILWGINVLYSFWIKKIAYLDILFISFTQPLKYFVALFLCGVTVPAFANAFPFFLFIYLIAVSLHARKQFGKLSSKSRRTFIIGKYTPASLTLLGDSFFLLSIISLVFLVGKQEFLWSFGILIVGVVLRYVLSAKGAVALMTRLGSIFQPR